jgi:SAM-dependent methyltransferase
MIAENTLPYVLPINTQDNNRLYFQHYVLKALLGSNTLAPLAPSCNILDVGCGEGIWALDIAQAFPSSRVVGFDIRPIRQFSYHDPSHFLLVTGDILSDLPFADTSFDYVHQRCLSPLIPAQRWQNLIYELARLTRPGGWIELLEYGSTYGSAGPNTEQLLAWSKETAAQHGFDPILMQRLEPMLQRAGIGRTQQRIIPVPLGKWGGTIGYTMSKNMQASIRSLKQRIISSVHISEEEFDQVLDALPTEWETHKTTYQFYATYGQRPYAYQSYMNVACRASLMRD